MNLKPLITLLIVFSFISACGGDTQNSSVTTGSQVSADNDSTEAVNKIAKAKPWRGSASGYVSDANTSDRLNIFIVLGKLFGAAQFYNDKAMDIRSMPIGSNTSLPSEVGEGQAELAMVFDQTLLASYATIASDVQTEMAKQKQVVLIQEAISELIQPQQIADIINIDRAQRDKRIAAQDKVIALLSRLHSVVLAFFPSRHEYLLASSALIREAGDKVAIAVSANGVILDADLLQEAFALIDKSEKLDPKNVSYCDAQRLPIRDHKDAIDDLLNKMVPIKLGQKISVTARDVYSLAKQAQMDGERFPVIDSSKCSE